MSPRFVLGQENVPCVAEVVNRSLKADCTDFTSGIVREGGGGGGGMVHNLSNYTTMVCDMFTIIIYRCPKIMCNLISGRRVSVTEQLALTK